MNSQSVTPAESLEQQTLTLCVALGTLWTDDDGHVSEFAELTGWSCKRCRWLCDRPYGED